MKKFALTLGLILILTCWGWQGYSGFGAAPAAAQGYYDPYYCDPNYYYNCYSAPYVDPNSQYFLYYVLPRLEDRRERERFERHERREHRRHHGERDYYEHPR